MNKFFIGLLCILVLVTAGIVIMYNHYLIFVPGTHAISIEQPIFAFAFDNGYVIIDHNGERILYCDQNFMLQWMHTKNEMLGTITGAAANPLKHELYLFDSISIEDIHYERLIRFDVQSGKPIETLLQYKTADKRSFVPRSLTLSNDTLLYMEKDSEGVVYLKKKSLTSHEEKGLFRTKWNIDNAEIAAFNSKYFIKSEGTVFLYFEGILQTLPEIQPKLTYCTAISHGKNDTLLLADSNSGILFHYQANGKLEQFARISELLASLTPIPEKHGLMFEDFINKNFTLEWNSGLVFSSGISFISYSSDKYLFIDNINNKIVIASDKVPDKCIQGVLLSKKTIQKAILTWSALAIACLTFLVLIFKALFSLHTIKNNLLTFLLVLFPSILVILLMLLLVFFNAERSALNTQQKAIQKQAIRAAQTAAALTDGDKLVKLKSDKVIAFIDDLKKMVSKTSAEVSKDILLSICIPGDVSPLTITDNLNAYRLYQPVRFIPTQIYAELLKIKPASYTIKTGSLLSLYALAPIADSSGNLAGFSCAKINILAPQVKIILQYTFEKYTIYFIIIGIGLVLIGLVFYLITNRPHERPHITSRIEKTDKSDEIETATGPVLEDDDFEIPVIPDVMFEENYNTANVFSIEELPPIEDASLLKKAENIINTSLSESSDNTVLKNKPLSPESSFFARASQMQHHNEQEHSIVPETASAKPTPNSDTIAMHKNAVSALKSGNYQLAISILEKLCKLVPSDTKVLNNLAIAYKRSGNTAKALDCLEKAVAINPEDMAARKNLELLRKSN